MRLAAFEHARRLSDLGGGELTAAAIRPGFTYEGERIPLANQQRGIFRPRQMRFLLSISTRIPKKGAKVWYDDQRDAHRQIYEGHEAIDYAFTGDDPGAADSRWLREACENQIPIIYFFDIAPGLYQTQIPTVIAGWDSQALKARVVFGAHGDNRMPVAPRARQRAGTLFGRSSGDCTRDRSVRPS